MPHTKRSFAELVNINNASLSNYNADAFFTKEVLHKRLRSPLKQHAGTLAGIYNLFKHKLHQDCRYVEAFIRQENKDILFTTFFDCIDHKYMLVILSQPESIIINQEKMIQDILYEYKGLYESQVALHDEKLPKIIHELIKELIVNHINKHSIRLKKIEAEQNDKTIIFHSVSFTLDLEGSRGISVLAGFQY